MRRLQTIASLAAAGALVAVPAVGQAHHKTGHAKGGNGGGASKTCAKKKAVNKGFVVKGTLVSFGAGAPAAGDETVTVTVTKMNRHARRSGLTDADSAASGTQYTLTGANGDPFNVQLSDFDGPTDTPSAGDRVRIVGKVAVTRKKCAPAGTSLEDRYGDVDVRRVKIVDAD